jgi:uncharacterized membrane protein
VRIGALPQRGPVMTLRRIVLARLARVLRDLRALVTLRRHEARWQTYALRLFVVAMIVVVIPAKKLVQLGIVGSVLALMKTALAIAFVAAMLAVFFAAQELARRRRLRMTRVAA